MKTVGDRPEAATRPGRIGGSAKPAASPPPGGIRVEIVGTAAFAREAGAWRALTEAAPEPNVFLEPAVLDAAQRADPATPIIVLLAWEEAPGGPRLAGVWALARVGRVLRRLRAPAVPLAGLGTPVIRPERPDAVIEAWFDALARSGAWPRFVEMNPVTNEGPVREALGRVIDRRRCGHAVEPRRRAALASPLTGEDYLKEALSTSRRSNLRYKRTKLQKQGVVAYTRHRAAAAVEAATEQFLALEASGWKGRRGTAIDRDPMLTAFARAVMRGLAAEDLASVTALTLDGRPISMALVLRSGRTAYTWKIAYDEADRAFSPGYLLVLEDTAALLADPDLDRVDSCSSTDSGIYADVWRERMALADLYLDVRRNSALPFRARMALVRLADAIPRLRRELGLRERARRLRNRFKRPGRS